MKREHAATPAIGEGALVGHVDGAAYGWACGSDGGDVVVEILGDGEPLALVHSGLRLPDALGLPVERARQGFVAALAPGRIAGLGRITARIANSACALAGAILPARDAAQPAPAFGSVVDVGCLRLTGWVLPPAGVETPAKVIAFVDGQWVAEGTADRRDPHLHAQGAPEGACAFDFTLPLALADGAAHRVTVCADDGRELPGSPLTVVTPPRGDRRWLANLPLGEADRAVLLALAARWRRAEPLSVGWAAYPEWQARFTPAPAQRSRKQVLVAIGPNRAGDAALRASLASLSRQTHAHWRALVWDEAAGRWPAGADAASYCVPDATDPRIVRVAPCDWAAALAREIDDAPYASFLPAGDAWHPTLLGHALHALAKSADICYCDADDASGGPPWFKPDWCLDTFLALPLLDHGFVCRSRLLAQASPHPQDWPWQAVAAGGGALARVAHVRGALHSRGDGSPCSTARIVADPATPTPAQGARPELRQLARGYFGVADWSPAADDAPHRVAWPDPKTWPGVCLLIPTRDGGERLRRCVDSVLTTDYPDLSVCVIDNQSACPDTLAYLDELAAAGVRVLRWPHAFNFAQINNHAAREVDAEVIGLVNDDVRVLDPQWLRNMARLLLRPQVGAVGAKLLWPNGMVQHAGVVLGMHGAAGHTGNTWMADDAGYHHCNRIVRSVSAVTAACLLLRRDDYLAVGGMDARAFPVAFNDVDLCLRLRERGLSILWAADAVLEHAESMSRGRDDTPSRRARAGKELRALEARWGGALQNDPFYNPNLNLDRYSHDGLAVPPRLPA